MTAARLERDTRFDCSRSRTATTTPSSTAGASRAGARWSRSRSARARTWRRWSATRRTSPRPITYVELAGGDIDREALRERTEQGIVHAGPRAARRAARGLPGRGRARSAPASACATLPDADAVVIATGGFERDPQLAKAFLRGPMLAPVGAPTAEGDGLRMAIAAGAALGNMSEAWWCPASTIPGETIDGAPMHRLILTERARPGCLIVDSHAAGASSTRPRTTTTSGGRCRTSSRRRSRSRTCRPG